jgi:hypothetical protein
MSHNPALGALAPNRTAAHRLLFAEAAASAKAAIPRSRRTTSGGGDDDSINSPELGVPQQMLEQMLFHCVAVGAPLKPCRRRSQPAAWLAEVRGWPSSAVQPAAACSVLRS